MTVLRLLGVLFVLSKLLPRCFSNPPGSIGVVYETEHLPSTLLDQLDTTTTQALKLPTQDPFRTFLAVCQDVSRNTSAYVSVTSCGASSWLDSVYERISVPSVSVLTHPCPQPVQQTVNRKYVTTLPGMESHVRHVISALSEHYSWRHIIILYDEDYESSPWLDQLMTSFTEQTNASVSLHNVDRQDALQVLEDVKRPAEFEYPHLVLASANTTKHLMDAAWTMQMRRPNYDWVVFAPDMTTEDVEPELTDLDNIAFILQLSEQDLACRQRLAQEVLTSMENALTSLRTSTKFLGQLTSDAGCKYQYSDSVRSELREEMMVELASGNLTSQCENEAFELRSALTGRDGVPRLVDVGRWSPSEDLYLSNQLFPNNYNGFHNRTFTVTSLEYSFFQKKELLSNDSFRWVGLTFEILDELSKDLNFSYRVVEPPDLMWGIEQEDHTWNGMIRQVMDKDVDFAAAGFSITAARETVVDFPAPYFHEQSVVILKRPSGENKVLLFAHVFKWQVWLGMAVSILATGVFLWYLTKASPVYPARDGPPKVQETAFFLFQNALWYSFGAFFQQGGMWLPSSQSGRMLVGCYWFYVIVVLATYTGNLIAFLAVTDIKMPFSSLDEMVRQDALSWGTATGVALVMLFRDANFHPYEAVYNGMNPVQSYAEGLRKVKDGTFAFIAEKSWYQDKVAEDCELTMMKEEFYPTSYAWALQTNAPYASLFSDRINKMREAGLLDKWIQKWTPTNLHCKGLGPVTQAKVATIMDVQGAFYLLFLGLFLAVVFLVGERAWHWYKDGRTRQKTSRATVTSGTFPHQAQLTYEETNGVIPNGDLASIYGYT